MEVMSQIIESPNESDIARFTRQLVYANELVERATGSPLLGEASDLALIHATLAAMVVAPEDTASLNALGLAFGQVLVRNNEFYDWCMVEDQFGRDPAIRYKETSLLVFPQTMISMRVENGQRVAVREMYEDLRRRLETWVR
jgi:Domain of unknown function (DUF3806)